MFTRIKTKAEIAAMRESGRILATTLQYLRKKVAPEITTKELARLVAVELKKLGGIATTLGYQGFPDVLCVSLNDEVVHGIPSPKRVIKEGDIVSLDMGVTYKGMITDAAISVIAGRPANSAIKQLLKDTERSLHHGIAAVRNGGHVGDIGAAVQTELDKNHYGIVRDMVGHGVGHDFHEDPNIPNYGFPGMGPILKTGMTIAIEPMATLGGYGVYIDSDGWTIKTRDGSWAAHFEHTVLVTEKGSEILTIL